MVVVATTSPLLAPPPDEARRGCHAASGTDHSGCGGCQASSGDDHSGCVHDNEADCESDDDDTLDNDVACKAASGSDHTGCCEAGMPPASHNWNHGDCEAEHHSSRTVG